MKKLRLILFALVALLGCIVSVKSFQSAAEITATTSDLMQFRRNIEQLPNADEVLALGGESPDENLDVMISQVNDLAGSWDVIAMTGVLIALLGAVGFCLEIGCALDQRGATENGDGPAV